MITKVLIDDARYALEKGAGSDAIHKDPIYSYAVTRLLDDSGIVGTGFAFTLGEGMTLFVKLHNFMPKN